MVHTNISKSNFKKLGVTGGAWFRRLRRSQSCVPFPHLFAAVPPHTLLEQPWSSLEQRGAALDHPEAAWNSLGVALGQSLGGLGQTASQSAPVNPPQSHFQAFPKNRPLNFLGLF